jgi:HrpA-like RNA helicase
MPTLLERNKLKRFIREPKPTLIDVESDDVAINYVISHITKAKARHQTLRDKYLILQAKTASGKSTVFVKSLYDSFERVNIVCSEPRVSITREIPNDIVKYDKKLKLGENIGYITGTFKKAPYRGILFVTLGVMYEQFKNMTDEEICDRYDFIIIDEVHERGLTSDVLLLRIKRFLKINWNKPKCPYFIFMSATLDPIEYDNYFGSNVEDVAFDMSTNTYNNIIYVDGFTYEIKEHFSDYECKDIVADAYDRCIELHNNIDDFKSNFRDIIVFMTSSMMLEELQRKLDKYNMLDINKNKFLTILYNRDNITKDNTNDVFAPLESLHININDKDHKVSRRIILSTTTGEIGLTVDTLKYVIDSGWSVSKEFYPEFNANIFLTRPIYKSIGLQRKGRVGRKASGEWYPLFTKDVWESLNTQQLPEIITNDAAYHILYVLYVTSEMKEDIKTGKKIYTYNVDELFNLLTCPSYEMINYALEKLFVLGYIDDHHILELGQYIFKTTITSLEYFKMIMSGMIFNINVLDLISVYLDLTIGATKDKKAKSNNFIAALENLDKIDNHDFIERQYAHINEFMMLGIDIYNGVEYNNNVDMTSYINDFKKCVYEGFKLNTLMLVNDTYIHKQRGFVVNVKQILEDKPMYIITDEINISTKNGLVFEADNICELDVIDPIY